MTLSSSSELRRALVVAGLILSVIRCAPEYTFSDGEGGTGGEVPGHCENRRQDRADDETGVDCGGACPACENSCLAGTAECDDDPAKPCETNTLTDAANCGACGATCNLANALASCSGGKCQVMRCSPSFDDCNGSAEDGCETAVLTDAEHCGACNERCSDTNGTAGCAAGSCRIDCDANWDDCNERAGDGCETQTARDARNCGGCGTRCTPDPGETAFCKAGRCGSTLCESGRGDCDGDGSCEAELADDAENCGACGHVCIVANGVGKCVAGECQIEECDPGFEDCDADGRGGGYATGCEVNLRNSVENCGACGEACSIEHGTPRCVAGECRISKCDPPFADCDADRRSCETDTGTDSLNCGGCMGLGGLNCVATFADNQANGVCRDGRCGFDGCHPGFEDCNEDELVCEVDRRSDPLNCGQCDVECRAPVGTVSTTCTDAMCQPVCAADYRDCDDDGANGCESAISTDVQNCGACDRPCATTGTTKTVCAAGVCEPTCSADADDCDRDGTNGCETDTSTDVDNCGQCGVECQIPAGTTSNPCTAGVCEPQCAAMRGDCDGIPQNGCETRVSDDANCGACKRACQSGGETHATSNRCAGTECEPECEPGYGACANPALGCTTRLNTAERCGACDNRCSGATPLCVAAGCQARVAVVQQVAGGVHGSRLTLSLNLQAAQNRLLLLAVSGLSLKPNSFEQGKPDMVTYGGTALQLYAQLNGGAGPTNSAGQGQLFYYYLPDAELMKLGTGAKHVEIAATSPQNSPMLAADAVLFSGVDQGKPFTTSKSRVVDGRCQDAANEPTDTIAVMRTGSVVYSLLAAQHVGDIAAAETITRTLGHKGGDNSSVVGGHLGVGGTLAAGSHELAWNLASCTNWTMLSVVLQPARR